MTDSLSGTGINISSGSSSDGTPSFSLHTPTRNDRRHSLSLSHVKIRARYSHVRAREGLLHVADWIRGTQTRKVQQARVVEAHQCREREPIAPARGPIGDIHYSTDVRE